MFWRLRESCHEALFLFKQAGVSSEAFLKPSRGHLPKRDPSSACGIGFGHPPSGGLRYMFGPTLLVAPIVSPGDDGEATSREVYFPSGEWIHFHTGNTHSGTQTVVFGVDQAPVFARSGSILESWQRCGQRIRQQSRNNHLL